MSRRKRTVSCPTCLRRLSPQGLNGHVRFVHGLGAAEAAGIVASAPRNPESQANREAEHLDRLQREVTLLTERLKLFESRSGMRRQLVGLVTEFATLKKQRAHEDWESWFSGAGEREQISLALDNVESNLRSEIAELATKLSTLAKASSNASAP